ncbi:hypothetical protein OV208_34740 [Corallococcus sp. bb12-1]|uniref:imm11 family protein n=1 Tax=Corallococcus sp. bb12-1 TaxID=2996784 RepID=UPI002270F88F|nr:DUF1629 domain-containing protein [Corallococcus sp. bb12-1]MCY1046515.1 hypothetical protein [Corallococcus sp. bb12-1]
MKYWILDGGSNDGALVDGGYPKSKIKNWRYHAGEPLAKEYPEDAAVGFSKKWPARRELRDFLDNSVSILIVSSRVRAILEKLKAKDLEFLPLLVKDHKGKPVPQSYFFLNPLGGQDAVDVKASDVVMDKLFKDRIRHFNTLVLNPKGIEKEAKLFRLSRARDVILVDDSVRKTFQKEGITGCRYYKAEGWNGLPIGNEEG